MRLDVTLVYGGGLEVLLDHDIGLSKALLDIADGEFVVLVGPSGCGKSTLLRMVAGLETISGGEIRIDQRVVNGLEPKERDIAMVFQNYALYPQMTVAENLGFALELARTPKAERERTNDARPSIEERYHGRDDYVNRVRIAARDLVARGFLLPDDAAVIVQEAAASKLFGSTPVDTAPR